MALGKFLLIDCWIGVAKAAVNWVTGSPDRPLLYAQHTVN